MTRYARRKSSNRLPLLIGGGILLTALVVVAVVLIVTNRRGNETAGNGSGAGGGSASNPAKVTLDNFRRVKPGIDLAEVEGILGGSEISSEKDLQAAHHAAFGEGGGEVEAAWARMTGATIWRTWEGKTLRVWVGFVSNKDGQPRAAYSVALERANGKYTPYPGFTTFEGRTDLDKRAEQRKKEKSLRDDPKWVRGAKARELLVGEWRDIQGDGYIIHPGGRLQWYDPLRYALAPERDSTYRVIDDTHVEIVTPSPFSDRPGHLTPFEFLVNQGELVLLEDRPQPAIPVRGPYYRMPAAPGNAAHTNLIVPLLAEIKSPDGAKRQSAFYRLKRLGKGAVTALPTLIELLASPDDRTASGAADAIGAMRELGAPAAKALVANLGDPNTNRSAAALQALGMIGPAARDALPALRELVKKTTDAQVRSQAEIAIRIIETGKP
jgi:hypothetical protein